MNPKKVDLKSVERVSSGFLNVDKYVFSHSLPDGSMTPPVTREVMVRGNAAAVLVYDQDKDAVLLIEEFRIGNYAAGLPADQCWSLGPIAGMIDGKERGVEAVLREAVEEAGLEIDQKNIHGPLRHFSSPGGASEILDIFVALADISDADPEKKNNDADEHTNAVIVSRDDLERLIFEGCAPASLVTALLLLDRVCPRPEIEPNADAYADAMLGSLS